MARSRTGKTISRRIDPEYFDHPHPLRRWRRILTWAAGLLALIWVAAASVRFTNGKAALLDRIHNPGPLTTAHARFQNDCSRCHTRSSQNGFSLAVTDASCLACHDGPIHHPNQKMAAEISLVSRDSHTLAIKDPNHAGDGRSANCVTCHVEHRGKAMLSATSNAHCVVCHADLSSASVAKPQAANRVVAFDVNDHPTFGRTLRGPDQVWHDPTVLAFNHKKHLEQEEIKSVARNCSMCHPPDPGDRRYMQPISFAANCKKCHELELIKEPQIIVAHADMSLVRAQLRDPGAMIRQWFRSQPPEKQQDLLKPAPAAATTGRRRGGAAPAPTSAEAKTEDQWVKEKVDKLMEDAGAGGTAPSDPAGLAALEKFAAKDMTQACAKCHQLKDGASPGELTTVATGIGTTPRRWFRASRFDHDAHRDVGCLNCHEAAPTSTNTSDLLMPDLNKAADPARTCVACHKLEQAPSSSIHALGDCVTCHGFHDRAFERPPEVAAPSAP